MSSEQGYLKYGVDDARIPGHPTTVVRNVRVFGGYSFGEPQSVAIADGKILGDAVDGQQFQKEIDGEGCFLLPGLIDCHAHPDTIPHLEALRAAGITTVMSLAAPVPAQVAALKQLVGLPDLYTAGIPAAAPNSTHGRMLAHVISPDDTTSTPSEAGRFVARRLADRVDFIKIIADTPDGMDQATLNALVNHAKQNDLRTMVHAARYAAFHMARRARPTMIHHVPVDRPLTDADDLAGDYIAVPTLVTMQAWTKVRPDTPPDAYDTIPRASVAPLRNAGVPILAGSDAADHPMLPFVMPFGESLQTELELLVGAGLTTAEVLRAATVLPPKYFGLADRGAVAPGMRADLLMVRGNPLEDIAAVRNVERVWLKGVEHTPSRK